MQGPGFAPPPMMGTPTGAPPPIKKQRAGGTPDAAPEMDLIQQATSSAVSRRRAELERLKTSNSLQPDLMDRARSSLLSAPPPPRGAAPSLGSRNPGSAVRGGGRLGGPPRGGDAPPLFGMQPVMSHPNAFQPQRPTGAFPGFPKSPQPPAKPTLAVADLTRSPARPNAAITAAAVKSPAQQSNKPTARRLDDSFTSNSKERSKSAPPSRPPPPPPPPLSAPEDDIAVNMKLSSKGVSFQVASPPEPDPKKVPLTKTPHPASRNTQQASEATPEETTLANAGSTPFHHIVQTDLNFDPSPPATARRDLLRNMRAFAETPPEKSRMQSNSATPFPEKVVGFLSPALTPTSGSAHKTKNRVLTPHPKQLLAACNDSDEQRVYWQAAAECSAYEYGGGSTENNNDMNSPSPDYFIRRPYGLAVEQELWYRAGQKATKAYIREATVAEPTTIEVVARIAADQSLLTVYGDGQARHHPDDGRPATEYAATDLLGTVTYIDHDANEREYSLDDIHEAALQVREHYCSIVRSTADGLRLKGTMLPSNNGNADTNTLSNSNNHPKVETRDQGMATDDTVAPSRDPETKQATMPSDQDSSLGASIVSLFLGSLFSLIWFVLVGLPLRILTSTFVLAMSAVLLSMIWLYLQDDHGATDMGATTFIYSNQPGIQ